jgi:hypothetical protein
MSTLTQPSGRRVSMEMHRELHMVNLWSGIELVLFSMRGCQRSIYTLLQQILICRSATAVSHPHSVSPVVSSKNAE